MQPLPIINQKPDHNPSVVDWFTPSLEGDGRIFTFAIEDEPKFHSEAAIFVESLIEYLEKDDEICIVVCNDFEELSDELKIIGKVYGNKLRFLFGHNWRNKTLDYPQKSSNPGMNKLEALKRVSYYCEEGDMIIHTDSDLFLYKEFNKRAIPNKDTLSWNWIIANDIDRDAPFFTYGDKKGKGIWTPELLEIMGCTTEYKGGGVSGFFTGKTLKNKKFIDDCFRFAHLLHSVASILDPKGRIVRHNASDMPCYALSLTYNNINYNVEDIEEFTVDNIGNEEIIEGSFYHYYSDLKNEGGAQGAFYKSKWYKQMYHGRGSFHLSPDQNLLFDNDINKYLENAQSKHESYFFELAIKARNKLFSTNYIEELIRLEH